MSHNRNATQLALSLSEIKEKIAQFLPNSDLARLTVVSYEWREAAQKYLYQNIIIDSRRPKFKSPSAKLLQENSRFIHSIEFSPAGKTVPLDFWFVRDCSKLREITFKFTSHDYVELHSTDAQLPIPPELVDVIPSYIYIRKTYDDEDDELFDFFFGDGALPTNQPNIDFPHIPHRDPNTQQDEIRVPVGDLATFFVSAHKNSLREIHLLNSAPGTFWKMAAQELTPTLESLTINQSVNVDHEYDFWMACRNLISLEVKAGFTRMESARTPPPFMPKDLNVSPLEPRKGPAFFPRLKNLSLSISQKRFPSHDIELLKNCPMLESLDWTRDFTLTFASELNMPTIMKIALPSDDYNLILSHSSYQQKNLLLNKNQLSPELHLKKDTKTILPFLHALKLDTWRRNVESKNILSDEELCETVHLLKMPLSLLIVPYSGFGNKTLSEMLNCSSIAIRKINIYDCPNVTSSMVQRLLVSCHLLEEIYAERLFVYDMMECNNQLWGCLNLRILGLVLDLAHPDYIMEDRWRSEEAAKLYESQKDIDKPMRAKRQQMIMMQLSRLTKLTYILGSKFTVHHSRTPYENVEFTLEAGLDQLKGLTMMEEIYIGGWCDPHIAEAEWMLRYWKKLRVVQKGRYLVEFHKWGHDLKAMFSADQNLWNDQEEFMVYS